MFLLWEDLHWEMTENGVRVTSQDEKDLEFDKILLKKWAEILVNPMVIRIERGRDSDCE